MLSSRIAIGQGWLQEYHDQADAFLMPVTCPIQKAMGMESEEPTTFQDLVLHTGVAVWITKGSDDRNDHALQTCFAELLSASSTRTGFQWTPRLLPTPPQQERISQALDAYQNDQAIAAAQALVLEEEQTKRQRSKKKKKKKKALTKNKHDGTSGVPQRQEEESSSTSSGSSTGSLEKYSAKEIMSSSVQIHSMEQTLDLEKDDNDEDDDFENDWIPVGARKSNSLLPRMAVMGDNKASKVPIQAETLPNKQVSLSSSPPLDEKEAIEPCVPHQLHESDNIKCPHCADLQGQLDQERAMTRKLQQEWQDQWQAIQLRLYIAETKCATYQQALDQHVQMVQENMAATTTTTTTTTTTPSPLFARVYASSNSAPTESRNES